MNKISINIFEGVNEAIYWWNKMIQKKISPMGIAYEMSGITKLICALQ